MALNTLGLTTIGAAIYHVVGYWASTYGKNESWSPGKFIRTAVAGAATLLGLHMGHVAPATAAGTAGIAGFGTFFADHIFKVIIPIVRKYDSAAANELQNVEQAVESNSGGGSGN